MDNNFPHVSGSKAIKERSMTKLEKEMQENNKKIPFIVDRYLRYRWLYDKLNRNPIYNSQLLRPAFILRKTKKNSFSYPPSKTSTETQNHLAYLWLVFWNICYHNQEMKYSKRNISIKKQHPTYSKKSSTFRLADFFSSSTREQW